MAVRSQKVKKWFFELFTFPRQHSSAPNLPRPMKTRQSIDEMSGHNILNFRPYRSNTFDTVSLSLHVYFHGIGPLNRVKGIPWSKMLLILLYSHWKDLSNEPKMKSLGQKLTILWPFKVPYICTSGAFRGGHFGKVIGVTMTSHQPYKI